MLTACDFLDEYNPNSVTVGNYYTSEEDIVASLNGVYTSLTQSYVADNYHYFTDVRANATVVTNSGANSGISLSVLQLYAYRGECLCLQPLFAVVQDHFARQYALRPSGGCQLCYSFGPRYV